MANINENNLYGLIYTMSKNMTENATIKLTQKKPLMVYYKYMYDCLNMGYLSVSMANTLKLNNPGLEDMIDDAKAKAQELLIQVFLDVDAATRKMKEYDESAEYDFEGKSAKDSPYLDKYDNEILAEVIVVTGEYTEQEIVDACGEVLRELAAEIDEALAGLEIQHS